MWAHFFTFLRLLNHLASLSLLRLMTLPPATPHRFTLSWTYLLMAQSKPGCCCYICYQSLYKGFHTFVLWNSISDLSTRWRNHKCEGTRNNQAAVITYRNNKVWRQEWGRSVWCVCVLITEIASKGRRWEESVKTRWGCKSSRPHQRHLYMHMNMRCVCSGVSVAVADTPAGPAVKQEREYTLQ